MAAIRTLQDASGEVVRAEGRRGHSLHQVGINKCRRDVMVTSWTKQSALFEVTSLWDPFVSRLHRLREQKGATSFSASQSSQNSRIVSSFGTLTLVMIKSPQISRSITMSCGSTVCHMQSTMLCVSEWLTPSSSAQWRKMGTVATTSWAVYSEAHCRVHRSRMVDAQNSITSWSPPHTKRSPSSSWQSYSQTSWSGSHRFNVWSVKDSIHIHSINIHVRARPLSRGNRHLTLVGGDISQRERVQHSSSTQWKGAQTSDRIALASGQLKAANWLDSSVSLIGIKLHSWGIHHQSMEVIARGGRWRFCHQPGDTWSMSQATITVENAKITIKWVNSLQHLRAVFWSRSQPHVQNIRNSDNSRYHRWQQLLSSSASSVAILSAAKLSSIP